MNARCSILCIVPPHMLENLVVNGNSQQREWAFRTLNVSAQFRGRRNVVGAVNFAVSPGQKRRTVFDAKNSEDLPGQLVRSEGDPPSKDPAVNEAYDAAGATYDLFYQVYERNSIDDKGLRLDSTVHYSVNYDNAFWNGDQMVYGDGDGEIFHRFTKAIDVIAHELTHGVTQHEANLKYYGEAGALNESFSDVFGILVKQRVQNQTAEQSNWLIGEGLFTSSVKGVAIRSMKAPGTAYDDPIMGKDPQPGSVKDIYTSSDDNGGVHINSGIPNHAFYLAATEIGGYAWEKAGKIWYVTLRDRLRSGANFKRAANVTVQVAGELYGQASKEQKAVQNAWQKVGVF
ncbi:peptidase M4 [Scytonema hofmannii PCC 7110]|uniref:Neutral metalloproteinase n=1 Tax=Scytonema hofmannii PCC 7110 TaxID=128403 RepID=A0A139X0T9_9CYAN|nr:M4 family metallopeptidase [Scytonema hofmannii]KYC38308.1 peptidase M4 [Scytonema hofmannii PCC 7110]